MLMPCQRFHVITLFFDASARHFAFRYFDAFDISMPPLFF